MDDRDRSECRLLKIRGDRGRVADDDDGGVVGVQARARRRIEVVQAERLLSAAVRVEVVVGQTVGDDLVDPARDGFGGLEPQREDPGLVVARGVQFVLL